ncbi:HTTM domain protein OS=Tsukamurella paurometabola (strain ATCC 8368 / DSM / CCUG 35730 / CIP 100753 / JCM 10117 / KCTC 9821 / NBRC 16120 / NCIMB 702349/ NCTC 13040) OX=521096 GN=Tpau_4244 PE=4 SV=1 [Tsukamurella paurometabola]|uniref:HTTM domain protein n=1 Tax=Tsukamurella paurometabola (strain ATCC 8368 / DSM 20162 / CCUG 35730 / CIP 100753 / JCM 10117 / KCTC 9821 / NBRC 16120 / NCIMB 702349 / NCTC 13040) TaxID=521096 RepID=D5UYW5_TSUPD|nr:sporulation-delaying protein SdpB family protein [Tsukamurella paurometabola]ADG80812.1 HTTM domain protein [Tsukamurella paurometabola DSM 20162]SUQ39263.1 antimicrobial peptide system protein, SdpB family [Tsukamurella paurometabola]
MLTDLRVPAPWTSTIGLVRSLIALSLAGTLTFSSPNSLFTYRLDTGLAPTCTGINQAFAFCLVERSYLGWMQTLAVIVLLVIASGWRPQFTCLPHWYVQASFITAVAAPDGGEQVATIMTLLLLPICLTDSRRWAWQAYRPKPGSQSSTSNKTSYAFAIAAVGVLLMKLQGAIIYFQSSVSKLSHDEWANGTAFYYWSTDPAFGMTQWLHSLLAPLLSNPWTLPLFTWGPLLIEIFLVFALFSSNTRFRRIMLAMGIGFHLLIGIFLGLWSFAITMWAVDIVMLVPLGWSLQKFLPQLAKVTFPIRSLGDNLARGRAGSARREEARHDNADHRRNSGNTTNLVQRRRQSAARIGNTELSEKDQQEKAVNK